MAQGGFIDITGNVYEKLTVISYTGKSKWLCKCGCGKEKIMNGKGIRDGKTKSCGCHGREQLYLWRKIANEKRFIDRTGERYGKLTLLSFAGRGKWNCKCECGNEKIVYVGHLTNGHTQSCGCTRFDSFISKSEMLLGSYIENEYQIKLERSYSIQNKVFDFKYKNILIESDGDYWHSLPKVIENDKYKDALQKENGFVLIRLRVNSVDSLKKEWVSVIKPILDEYLVTIS